MAMRRIPLIVLATLSACSVPQSVEPSLAPRAAESVDPRVPIPGDVVVGPADPALVARIAELLAEVRAGDATFQSVVPNAEALAAAAGPAQSESWIVAQEALSGLVAARAPVTKAIADLDALAAIRIAASGGILPGDLAAIEAATAEAGAIGQRQADLIDRLQARLAA
jgi:hypothetical protein